MFHSIIERRKPYPAMGLDGLACGLLCLIFRGIRACANPNPPALAQVRHGSGWKKAKSFRFSSGYREVCTTFLIHIEALGQSHVELIKQRALLGRGSGDAPQADLAALRGG